MTIRRFDSDCRSLLFDPPCRNPAKSVPRGKAIWNANGGFVSVLMTHLFYITLLYSTLLHSTPLYFTYVLQCSCSSMDNESLDDNPALLMTTLTY